mmetsp:Transcript_31664/g.59514  ORF Transcript_31664/g.59514 Transcript_31664/m.59514 type:complete len:210 (+) Transcript_31664:972-1601(+)
MRSIHSGSHLIQVHIHGIHSCGEVLHVPLASQHNAPDVVHLPLAVGEQILELPDIEFELVHILSHGVKAGVCARASAVHGLRGPRGALYMRELLVKVRGHCGQLTRDLRLEVLKPGGYLLHDLRFRPFLYVIASSSSTAPSIHLLLQSCHQTLELLFVSIQLRHRLLGMASRFLLDVVNALENGLAVTCRARLCWCSRCSRSRKLLLQE